jgi:phospholipid transport system substrate-binding protein
MKKRILGLTIILLMLLIFPLGVNAGGALESIQTQVNKVLDVLRDPALKAESALETKEKKIWEIADNIFDYPELSKRTLARNWKKFTPDQQKEFTDLFGKLLGDVYMDRILEYDDQKVVFEKELSLGNNKAEVKSRIVTSSREIPMNYRMIEKNGEWRVYDVIIEGVSMVKNYRSQFRKILTNKSPEDLLKILRKKVAKA